MFAPSTHKVVFLSFFVIMMTDYILLSVIFWLDNSTNYHVEHILKKYTIFDLTSASATSWEVQKM